MPWFIHTAETRHAETNRARLVTIGPFTTEKLAVKIANTLRPLLLFVSEPIEFPLSFFEESGELEVFVARYRWMISDPNAHEGASFEAMRSTEAGRLFEKAIMDLNAKCEEQEASTDLPPPDTT